MTVSEWVAAVMLMGGAAVAARVLRQRSRSDAGVGRAPAPLTAVPAVAAPEETAPRSQPRAPATVARISFEDDADVDPTKVSTNAAAAVANAAALKSAASAAATAPQTSAVTVRRLVYDEDAELDEPTHAHALFLVWATAQTDRGLRRKRNEDALLVLENRGLFVVADGMGGYRGGELASSLAVNVIREAFEANRFELLDPRDLAKPAAELASAIAMANRAIFQTAKEKPELSGMGTTVCAARFSATKRRLYIGHVGDSRCYLLRNGVFKQMTADHTMRDFGIAGPEAAHLSRAVGIWESVPIDVVYGVPMPGDLYLLCSDGLTKMLPDETIRAVLMNESDPDKAVERLIFFANARGGKDNTSVIIVRVAPVGSIRPKPPTPSVLPTPA